MLAVLVAACALAGLGVGLLLNVAIDRVPDRRPIGAWTVPCGECSTAIPVMAAARRRCASCGTTLPGRYPLVAVVTGGLWVLAAVRFEASWALPAYLLFFAVLVAISFIDLDQFKIPNLIVYPSVLLSVPLLALVVLLEGDGAWWPLARALIGAVVSYAFLMVIHLAHPAGMGYGDVKLAALLGLYLGLLGMGHVALGLFLGFLIGALVGLVLMMVRARSRRDPIPFGPFLAAGAVVAVLWGRPLLDWYTGS